LSCCTRYPDKYDAFLALPRDERAAALAEYPPETQLDAYVWAMLVKHPPQVELAEIAGRPDPFREMRRAEKKWARPVTRRFPTWVENLFAIEAWR
jgi:hypothetical protein